MRWSIGNRIFLALALTSVLIIVLNASATRWSFQKGFVDYVGEQESGRINEIADQLTAIYERDGSWADLTANHRQWNELFRDGRLADHRRPPPPRGGDGNRRPPPGGPSPGGPMPRETGGLKFRVSLLDVSGAVIIGPERQTESATLYELNLDGHVIGALNVSLPPGLTEQIDLNFVNQQTRSILSISAAIILLAALLAMLISRQLVKPIGGLADATRALADGDVERRITVVRDDELGDLARDFNGLAETLQTNQQLRRQWVSDISHELRTPLAILQGELEAIEDGVRRFDDGARASLQAEVARLSKLVGDLHELTLSDEGGLRYEFAETDIVVARTKSARREPSST